MNKPSISCAAFGTGEACPSSSAVAGIEGADLTIPTLPVNTLAYNTALDTDAVNGLANISVTKKTVSAHWPLMPPLPTQ